MKTIDLEKRNRMRPYYHAYYLKHKDKILEYSKRTWPDRKPAARARNLMRDYGMTTQDFDAMIEFQGGVCGCCGSADWGGRGPYVDHDHKTGRVRAILCLRCNAAMGLVKEDPARAMRLYQYIIGWA